MSEKYGDDCVAGFYGWRRRCLLFFLLLLLFTVVVNFGLTLWMLKVLHFNSKGLGSGNMRIIPGGVQIRSESLVINNLLASKISSRKGQPVRVESSRELNLQTTASDGRVLSRVSLKNDNFDLNANSFKIADTQGNMLFSADKREVMYGADKLEIFGDGGTVVHGSLQTPLVRPEAGQNLTLESPTRNLNVFSLHGVNMESRAGAISAQTLHEFKLKSQIGAIRLDASNIQIPSLDVPKIRSTLQRKDANSVKQEVFQVCICSKGRLFLAPAEGPCVADNDVCR